MSGHTTLYDAKTDQPVTEAVRIIREEVTPTLVYEGRCHRMDAKYSQALWQLRRIRISDNVEIIDYAGEGRYLHKWTERKEEFSRRDFIKEHSVALDGINERITFGDNYGNDALDPFTFSIWIKPLKMHESTLFHKGEKAGFYENEYYLDIEDNELRFCIAKSKDKFMECRTSKSDLREGYWHHVALAYDGNLNGAKFYINGKLQDSDIRNNTLHEMLKIGGDFHLGAKTDIDYYQGLLTEFALFNKELNEKEIQEIYNKGECREMLHIDASHSLKHWYRLGDHDNPRQFVDCCGHIHGRGQNIEPDDTLQKDVPNG